MEKILIIDDEELNRTATEMTLKRAGYKVFTADSGEHGLELMKDRKYDLILLDIDMPEMSGLETLEIIRDTPRFANAKVVFLTASGFREDVTEAIRLGAMDFLRKPCTPAILLERVQHALARVGKDTVMIVDDELMNLQAVKTIFGIRYQVLTAKSGEEALELLKNHRVDLFLLDLHMPEMDGLELFDHIRDIPWAEDLPVIFLTGDTEPETEIKIFRAGAMDYLKKPVIAQVALQRVNRILELKHLQDSMSDELDEMYRKLAEKPGWKRSAEKDPAGGAAPEDKSQDPGNSQSNTLQREGQEEERNAPVDIGVVRELKNQFVEALLATLAEKDPAAVEHARRVGRYAGEIARRMGKTETEAEEIADAGLLCDIGKIGLPKKLLEKTERLKGDDLLIYQNHVGIGANILENIQAFPEYAIAAHWHHERYDGQGYPDGKLAGEIPEIARIVGVADSYETMISDQGYRNGLPKSMAREEFEKDEGRRYDPRIARIMVQIIDESMGEETEKTDE